MFSEHIYLYALLSLPQLGPIKINQLLAKFNNSPKKTWQALDQIPIQGISSEYLYQLRSKKKEVNLSILEQSLTQSQTKTIAIMDKNYPNLLKQIPDAPPLLFYKGVLPKNELKYVTVVGTRTMSRYGYNALEEILAPLCQQGIGIISGLAFGIDAHAHKLALKNHAYTAGVLGSSVDKITPSRHDLLAQEIIESGGAIISESPPQTNAYDGSFPRRNRILAGFSSLSLIVEAAERSGALITAKYALDYNREIATIPGSIFSQTSKGCHNLIKQGAQVITSSDDLLKALDLEIEQKQYKLPINLSDTEIKVLKLLSPEPQPIDLLIPHFEGRSAELYQLLTQLELKNLIESVPGLGYCLKKSI